MSIIITDLEMPTERESFNLTIKYNGTVLDTETGMQVAEAHELPPHGRLIDADALAEDLKRQCEEVFKIGAVSPDDFWITRDQAYNERLWKTWCESFFEYLKTRETVIPASEEGE